MDPRVEWVEPDNDQSLDDVTAAWPRLFTRDVPDPAGGWTTIEVPRETWAALADPTEPDVWPYLKDFDGTPLEHRLVITRDRDAGGPRGRVVVIAAVYETGFVTWSALPHLEPHPRGYPLREARRALRAMVTEVYDLLEVRPHTVLDDDLQRADPTRRSPRYMAMCDAGGPFTTEYDVIPQGLIDPDGPPDGPHRGALVMWKDGKRRPPRRRPRRGFPTREVR